jgi:hypothetical protein
MLVELRGRSGWRDRFIFTCKTSVPILVILMTTVGCARPDLPEPLAGLFEPPSSAVTDVANRQVVQQDKGQPKVQREQPRPSGSPKVAAEAAPKGASGSRQPSKKANNPPRPDAQEEQQLYQEFLEWRRRQQDQP